MKKMLIVSLTALSLMVFSGAAFAANPVAEIATTKGGNHIAECAQMMERGVSSVATGTHVCEK